MKEHKYKVGDLLEVTDDGVVGTDLKESEMVEVTDLANYGSYNVKDGKGRSWLLYEQNLRIRKVESKTETKFRVITTQDNKLLFSSDTYQKAERFCQEYSGGNTLEIKKVWIPIGAKNAFGTN